MDSPKPEAEKRKIRLHPSMVFDIITKQSGTREKAFAELITNSLDAGSTRCDITLGPTSFVVADDGRGFLTRQEIEDFFETFGTPHSKGDATFGTHRIGRGQIMAFARTAWRSGHFEMKVDVQSTGADYDFLQHSEAQPGCQISGTFYRSLEGHAVDSLTWAIARLVEFVAIPVYINGRRVNRNAEDEHWDVKTDDFLFSVRQSGGMRIYNMGMFVSEHNPKLYGGHGILISRRALTLNWARTDILEDLCQEWGGIRVAVRDFLHKRLRKKPTLKVEEREALWHAILRNDEDLQTLFEVPLIRLSNGQYKTVSALKHVLSVSTDGDPIADKVIQSGLASVLSPWTVEQVGGLDEFFDVLATIGPEHDFIPLEDLASNVTTEYQVVGEKGLSIEEQIALRALRKANRKLKTVELARYKHRSRNRPYLDDDDIAELEGVGLLMGGRKLYPGRSNQMVQAWTDGESMIAIDVQYAVKELRSGPEGASRLMAVLVHEYSHSGPSNNTHIHGPEFHEIFHENIMRAAGSISAAERVLQREFSVGLLQANVSGVKGLVSELSLVADHYIAIADDFFERRPFQYRWRTAAWVNDSQALAASVLDRRYQRGPSPSVGIFRQVEQHQRLGRRLPYRLQAAADEWRRSLGEVSFRHPPQYDRAHFRISLSWEQIGVLCAERASADQSAYPLLLISQKGIWIGRKYDPAPTAVLHGADLYALIMRLPPEARRTYCLAGPLTFVNNSFSFDLASSYAVPPWEWEESGLAHVRMDPENRPPLDIPIPDGLLRDAFHHLPAGSLGGVNGVDPSYELISTITWTAPNTPASAQDH